MRILLVDDDQSTLVTLKIALKNAGFDVRCQSTGQGAIDLLKSEAFDWLITDGHMSPIHGFTVAQEAYRFHPEIRTIMISGVCDESDIKDWPIIKLFPKPIEEESLIAFIKHNPAPGKPA